MAYTDEQKTTYIYALCDPVTNKVCYIGKANNLNKRLKSHLRDSKRRNTPVYQWINSLLRHGKIPKIIILCECGDDWPEIEKEMIIKYRKTHPTLLNVSKGGKEPHCPIEVRAKNGRNNAKAIHNDPERKKLWKLKRDMGESLKNGEVSKETRIKLRNLARKRPEILACFVDININ